MSVELRWLSDFVKQRSAIVLPSEKDYLVHNRLTPLAHQQGLRSLDELATVLRREPEGPLAELVVEAMTTNETSFFRDVHPWVHLAEALRELRDQDEVRIWCAAASAGQEPWTIAMVAREALGTTPLSLWATDLSRAMIERCETGVYSHFEVQRGLDDARLERWFQPRGRGFAVRDELRRGIAFEVQNLVRPWKREGPFHIVFMRNVLFYFDVETRREVLQRLRAVLAPGALLFLGAAESTLHLDGHFERVCSGKSVCFRLRHS